MIVPDFLIILIISNLLILVFFSKIDEFFNIRDYSDGKRKFQKRPVTLLGGSILILNFLIYLSICTFGNENFTYNFTQQSKEYFSLVFGSILFYLFGLYDDKFKLKPNYKLIVSFILVTVFVLVDNKLIISEINFSFVENKIELKNFSYFFTVLAFLLFMNALNMFDGINLQSGFYCLLIFCLFIYKNIFFNLSLSIIIPLILFLYLNLRNKIYLGESGIQLLAFLISYIFIKSNNFQNFKFYADEIFVIMAIPGLDMFRLFISRLISGKHPFKPDTNHIHHLIAEYFSKLVTFLTILIFIILSTLLYYFFQNKLNYIICYIIGYTIIITYLLKLKKKKIEKNH
tara:strand:+ start:25 stop:1056 length:1032 start_codon:yes stop_codon:yes gene_type:complete